MSPLHNLFAAIGGIEWGWKIAGLVVGGLAIAVSAAVGLIRGPIQNNAEAIEMAVESETAHYSEFTEFQRSMNDYIQTDSARWNRVLCHLEEARKSEPNWVRCER